MFKDKMEGPLVEGDTQRREKDAEVTERYANLSLFLAILTQLCRGRGLRL